MKTESQSGNLRAAGFSRRDFLESSGLLIVSFRLGGLGGSADAQSRSARDSALAARPDPAINEVDSYLANCRRWQHHHLYRPDRHGNWQSHLLPAVRR